MTGNERDERDERCEHEDMAVGWALHALEPADEAAFGGHLPGCARCRATVRSTEDVGAVLGGAVPREEPPARLRGRLLAMIDETDQVPRPTVHVDRPATVVPLPRRSRAARVLAAAAGVVLLVGVTVLGIRVGQLTGERDQLAAQAAESDQLRAAMAAVGDPLSRRAVLQTNQGKPAAILVSGKQNATVLTLTLAPNDAGHIYVVWGMSGPKPVPLATFDVAGAANAAHALMWGPDAAKHTGFALSLEPGRTAPVSPTDVVAAGQERR